MFVCIHLYQQSGDVLAILLDYKHYTSAQGQRLNTKTITSKEHESKSLVFYLIVLNNFFKYWQVRALLLDFEGHFSYFAFFKNTVHCLIALVELKGNHCFPSFNSAAIE